MSIFWVEHDNEHDKLLPPCSATSLLCLKNYPHNVKKYKIKGTLKISVTQLFSEIGKIWKNNLGLFNLHSKKPNFPSFYELA